MKLRISLVIGMAALLAACAQPQLAPVSNLGVLGSNPTSVRVESGDTLFGIAHRYNLPIRSIIEANRLTPPYYLGAGTTLIIPSADAALPPNGMMAEVSVGRQNRHRMSAARKVAALSRPSASGESSGQIETAAVPPPEPVAPVTTREKSPPAAVKPAAAVIAPPPITGNRDASHHFMWPLRGRIVEGYGSGANGIHNDGINIAARVGTPVDAAAAGEVVYVGNELRGYGNLVLIKHDGGYLTAYAHNSAILVHKGEHVARGQPIARVGATGEVREPQLHFEIRAGRNPVDPTDLLPPVQQAAAN